MKKRIILIGSVPPPYHGSSIYFNNLLHSKIKDEFDVHHLDTSDHRNLDNLSKLELTNVYLALRNIFQLIRMLGKVKPEIVYVPVAANFLPYLRDGMFLLVASYFSKAKVVIHLHGGKYFRNEFYNKSGIFVRKFVDKTLSKVDTAIVLSEKFKMIFEGLVKNTVAVPNGTDFGKDFTEADLVKKNTGVIKIGFMGNLFESKGVTDILNSVRQVIEKNKTAEFRFAGAWSGNETENICREIIKTNALENNVKFCGVLLDKDKEKFLLETDIFLFPSRYPFEGFPLVLIEAMSAGCAVISTKNTGAISEIVSDGITGTLIEENNPGQISEAVIKLIEDSELRTKMGKAGRDKYEKHYKLEKNISGISRVLNKTTHNN